MSLDKITSPFTDVDGASELQWCLDKLDSQHASDYIQKRKQWAFSLLDIRPGQKILDAGCGTGADVIEMAKLSGARAFVYGIDRSFKMVRESKKRAENTGLPISFAVENVLALGLPDRSFDRCFVERVFQHLTDPRKALMELHRVLKPGGRLVIIETDHELVAIDTPYKEINRRFIQWRSDTLASGDVAHRLHGWLKELGWYKISVEISSQIFTSYAERRKVAPYLEEIRIAQQMQIVTKEEADRWSDYLEKAIAEGRYLSTQASFIIAATK